MEIHVPHAHGSTGLDNLAFDKSLRIDNRIKTLSLPRRDTDPAIPQYALSSNRVGCGPSSMHWMGVITITITTSDERLLDKDGLSSIDTEFWLQVCRNQTALSAIGS